jgi:alpha-galactosidase
MWLDQEYCDATSVRPGPFNPPANAAFLQEIFTCLLMLAGISISGFAAEDRELNTREIREANGWARCWFPATDVFAAGEETGFHAIAGKVPFSFVYGGRHSSEILPAWRRTVVDQPLDASRSLRRIVYHDPATGLECEVALTLFQDSPALDWVLSFRQTGTNASLLLEQAQTLDAVFRIPSNQPVRLRRSKGSSCAADDFQPVVQEVAVGQAVAFGPVGGRSSDGELPFYRVQWADGGLCVAVGWSGQWKASVKREGDLRMKAGLDHLRARLHPGEGIRLPRVCLVYWSGEDYQRGHNLYRRLALRHFAPKINGRVAFPIIAHNSAYDELHNANETNQFDIIQAARAAGLEGFWLDAYWFEGYFPAGVGNWSIPVSRTVRARGFPHGLEPLAHRCRDLGLKFVLWFEPERVAPGTRLDREFPQWVLRVPNDSDGLWNLGNPEARQWMTDYLGQCIQAYQLDVLRIDFNIRPLPIWRAADTPGREGLTEVKYVSGLYQMWDELLQRFPRLVIDNCASGGRRIDLETNRRSVVMWRSDHNDNNTVRGDPLADQGMTMGLTLFAPLNAGPVWRSGPYWWRCASVGGPVPYWDLRRSTDSREQCRLAVRESQELRPYALGDFWLLTENSLARDQWAAWQFHRPEHDDGCALFFRRDNCPSPAFEPSLRGIRRDVTYQVSFHAGYREERTEVMSGAQLAQVRIEIPERQKSLLLRYQRSAL